MRVSTHSSYTRQRAARQFGWPGPRTVLTHHLAEDSDHLSSQRSGCTFALFSAPWEVGGGEKRAGRGKAAGCRLEAAGWRLEVGWCEAWRLVGVKLGACTLEPTPWSLHPGACTLEPAPWSLEYPGTDEVQFGACRLCRGGGLLITKGHSIPAK